MWEMIGDELVGKRVYGHASEQMPFWKGAYSSLEWGKQYALERVKQFVVGGDGANWIHKGVEALGHAVFHLDGFHLSRAVQARVCTCRWQISRVWPRLWQTDRNFCLRWHTCRINDGCPAGDVLSTTRTDQDGTQRQRVRRVQREYWSGLAQPGTQRSPGRAEPGNHGIQRGQAHREPNEEAGYELDHTGSAPYGQSDPVESER